MKLLQLPLLALRALTPEFLSAPRSTGQCLDTGHAHNFNFINPSQSNFSPPGYIHDTSNDAALPIRPNDYPSFFSGGGERSYHTPALIDGHAPRLINASEAAEWYPGEWEGSAYAWTIFPAKDYRDSEPRLCLCQVDELCGCGSAAWKTLDTLWIYRMIDQKKGPKGWGVNGTASEYHLRGEWNDLSMAAYGERDRVLKVEREKGPTSQVCQMTGRGELWDWWVWWMDRGHPRPDWCLKEETSEL